MSLSGRSDMVRRRRVYTTTRSYSLGQFFAIWRQPLNVGQVAGVNGKPTIWVNGDRYVGNPANIRLGSHEDVQIDIGAPAIGPKTIRLGSHSLIEHGGMASEIVT